MSEPEDRLAEALRRFLARADEEAVAVEQADARHRERVYRGEDDALADPRSVVRGDDW